MSRALTTTATSDKNALASESPWMWVYEIEIPTSPPTRYRLVRNLEAISWRGFTFSPANIGHGTMAEDAQASIASVTLTIQNVTREIIAIVDAYAGLGDQAVDIYLVPKADLASGQAVLHERYSVIRVSANESAVSLELGQWNAYRTKVPGKAIMRSHCGWKFRSEECGYIGTDHATCDQTLTGADGCEAKASDSTEHPARFGGFPLTPRTSGIGVKTA